MLFAMVYFLVGGLDVGLIAGRKFLSFAPQLLFVLWQEWEIRFVYRPPFLPYRPFSSLSPKLSQASRTSPSLHIPCIAPLLLFRPRSFLLFLTPPTLPRGFSFFL